MPGPVRAALHRYVLYQVTSASFVFTSCSPAARVIVSMPDDAAALLASAMLLMFVDENRKSIFGKRVLRLAGSCTLSLSLFLEDCSV